MTALSHDATARPGPFTPEQKEYLAGVFAAAANGRSSVAGSPTLAATAAAEPTVHGTPLGDLCREERWKHEEHPLDGWDRLLQHAEADKLPDAENTYRFKNFGLFHVAPAQDSLMLRLRVPACEISSAQFHGLADLARECGGGYAHITTRGNIQVREIKPRDMIRVLTRLQDLGLTARGSGVDNIRNVTASPNSGFDPDELIDVRPYAKALHHYILNHREMYGLPRKFNVAFDNGGSLSVAAATNDIAFVACTRETGAGFRVQVGGITGHLDFARDTGLLVTPAQSVAVAAAMIRVFIEHGDRTNRKKARLKYLLDRWGLEKFVAETQRKLSFPLEHVPLGACRPRRPVIKHGWLGPARQSQRGYSSLGIGLPAGRLTPAQMHGLAALATTYGRGELRLTVWQNVIVPHIADAFLPTAMRAAQRLGLTTEAGPATGIIACTGNRGCKYSAADTKAHAVSLGTAMEKGTPPALPLNIHFTGCPHSCAQHYCGDIGLVGNKLPDGAEGYNVVLGGGMDHEEGIAREIFRGLRASEINPLVARIVAFYNSGRAPGETFVQWSRRHSVNELQVMLSQS